MGSLTALKARVAELLDEEPKAINSRSLFLTKVGLLTSEGRGKTAIARPSDATNLLLAFLGGGRATDVVNTVISLRNAKGKHPGKNSPDLPPVDCFQSLPFSTYDDLSARAVRLRGRHYHLLGDVLDAMFADWSRREGLPTFTDVNEPIEDVDLVVRHWKEGWSAEVSLSDGEAREWKFSFVAGNSQTEIKSVEDFEKRGDRLIRESVGFTTFYGLSKELRST